MSGVLATKGMQLRIPAGGLVLRLDEPPSPVIVEISTDTWDDWLSIAAEMTRAAEDAHDRLLDGLTEPEAAVHVAPLRDEYRAAIQAISATAIAVDAFYASVKNRAPIDREVEQAWRRNGTARYACIAETLQRAFEIKPRGLAQLRDFLEQLFRFRDWAVHPPADFRAPVAHPDIGSGVDWRFVAFSAANARQLLDATDKILGQLFELPRKRHERLVAWTASGPALLREAMRTPTGDTGE
jgi:hypothetical protein